MFEGNWYSVRGRGQIVREDTPGLVTEEAFPALVGSSGSSHPTGPARPAGASGASGASGSSGPSCPAGASSPPHAVGMSNSSTPVESPILGVAPIRSVEVQSEPTAAEKAQRKAEKKARKNANPATSVGRAKKSVEQKKQGKPRARKLTNTTEGKPRARKTTKVVSKPVEDARQTIVENDYMSETDVEGEANVPSYSPASPNYERETLVSDDEPLVLAENLNKRKTPAKKPEAEVKKRRTSSVDADVVIVNETGSQFIFQHCGRHIVPSELSAIGVKTMEYSSNYYRNRTVFTCKLLLNAPLGLLQVKDCVEGVLGKDNFSTENSYKLQVVTADGQKFMKNQLDSAHYPRRGQLGTYLKLEAGDESGDFSFRQQVLLFVMFIMESFTCDVYYGEFYL